MGTIDEFDQLTGGRFRQQRVKPYDLMLGGELPACKTDPMPRHVYRVTLELIHSDAGGTLPAGADAPKFLSEESFQAWARDREREQAEIEALRARILGQPGLVKYPGDVTPSQSWGKELRRDERQVIELDIDRSAGGEHDVDRACLLQLVDFLTEPGALGEPVWARSKVSPWPDGSAWFYDGTTESAELIEQDISRLVPGSTFERTEHGLLLTMPSSAPDDPSWIAQPEAWVVYANGHISTWSSELFDGTWSLHRTDQLGETEPEQLHTPEEWEEVKRIKVLDPDGWMSGSLGPKSWTQPISEKEFDARATESTVDTTP